MKIEKDGIIKELDDKFMLADYISAGWKISEPKKEKPRSSLKFKDDEK